MKKAHKQLILATTLASSAFVAVNVQADEVTPVSSQAVTNTQSQASVTTQDVSQAKANMDKAETARDNQAEVVTGAKEQVADAQAKVDSANQEVAEAEKLAKEATPEAIQKADEAITSADEEVSVAKDKVSETQDDLEKAQAEVGAQEKAVADTKTKADKAEANSKTAQDKVDTLASDVVDLSRAQDDVAVAEVTVASKEAEVKTAENGLAEAQVQDAKLDQDIASAKAEVTEKEADVEKAQDTVKDKEAVVAKAQTTFAKAKADAEAVKPLATWSREAIELQMSEGVKTALKEYLDGYIAQSYHNNSDSRLEAMKRWDSDEATLFDKVKSEVSSYYGGEHDENNPFTTTESFIYTKELTGNAFKYLDGVQSKITLLDANKVIKDDVKVYDDTVYNLSDFSLPQEVKELLNQYFVDIVNTLRQGMGVSEIKANKILMEESDVRSELYKVYRTSSGGVMSHNDDVINQAHNKIKDKYGVASSGSENIDFQGTGEDNAIRSHATLKELMYSVKLAALRFTIFDVNSDTLGHFTNLMTHDLVGLSIYNWVRPIWQQEDGSYEENYMTMIREIVLSLEDIQPSVTVSTNGKGEVVTTPNPESVARIKHLTSYDVNKKYDDIAYRVVLEKQTNAGNALKSSQEDVANAKTAVEAAQKAVDEAKANVVALESSVRQTPSAQETLNKAKAKLAEAEKVRDDAKVVLNSLTASAEAKAKVLAEAKRQAKEAKVKADEAQSELVAEQTKLDDLKAQVIKAEKAFDQAKSDLSTAQKAVETAKAYKTDLENAQPKLVEAEEKLAEAQARLTQAQANLEAEQEKQAESQAKYDEAKAIYDNLLAQYQAQKAIEEAKQSQSRKGTKGGYTDMLAFTSRASAESVRLQTQAMTNQVQARRGTSANYQASLPSTGDKGTAIYSLMGLLALGTSLALAGKRKEN